MRSADAGALMHVAATTAEALIVVCGTGAASQRSALSHIVAVDPPSAHVQLKEVQLLQPPLPPLLVPLEHSAFLILALA